jgi:hypothetical protein
MPETHGLLKKTPKTCKVCGEPYTARKASQLYCSNACRRNGSRYGKSYGNTEPKPMKVYR